MVQINCMLCQSENNVRYVFSKVVKNIKNKKEFKNKFFACLNLLSKCNFEDYKKPTIEAFLFKKMLKEFNYDACEIIIDNEDKGDVFISLVTKDRIALTNNEIANNMIAIRKFNPKNWTILNKYLLKNLKPKQSAKG